MDKIKNDFPIFQTNPDLVYLDTAASSQTPQTVLDAVDKYYTTYRSNIHRGLYSLAAKATEEYESARQVVANYLNAMPEEVIFTSGATHSLNLLASSIGQNLKKGDNVVLTRMEHHANLIPWQQASQRFGFEIRFIELNSDTTIDLDSAKEVIDGQTKVVGFCWISNSLGTIAPAKELVTLARHVGALSVIDAAQVAGHQPIDVKDLDCDFLVFSGHKMYGPTGIGVLFGKKQLLQTLEPFHFGGEMIDTVTYSTATWAPSPAKFEAGTPNIAGAIGLAKAVEYLSQLGWEKVTAHEEQLKQYALSKLLENNVRIVGREDCSGRNGTISFSLPGVHPHDVAEILAKDNICVRAGHHCTMPLMNYLKINGTARMSLGIYNSQSDIDKLVVGINKVREIFKT